jgi:hypothetical protein
MEDNIIDHPSRKYLKTIIAQIPLKYRVNSHITAPISKNLNQDKIKVNYRMLTTVQKIIIFKILHNKNQIDQ